jgi:hypothetical protein
MDEKNAGEEFCSMPPHLESASTHRVRALAQIENICAGENSAVPAVRAARYG